MRLRASGVHRAEFAPAAPLDFDANCNLLYHYTRRSLENLACDSPLGDGRMHLSGEKLGLNTPAQFTVELDRIPVAAGLDVLRTFRSGLDPDLEASGTVSGKIVYAGNSGSAAPPAKPANKPARGSPKLKRGIKAAAEPTGPVSGSLTVADFVLSGGGLSRPVQAPKITLQPSAAPRASATALTGTVTIPAGGDTPLVFNLRISLAGYQVGVRGQAAIARARELAHAAGIPQSQALAALAGDPLTVDLTAAGPWMAPEENFLATAPGVEPAAAVAPESPAPDVNAAIPAAIPASDSLTGTVTVHNVNWKADFLASHVEISEATLHLDGSSLRWDPVAFSYGPVKGTISLSVPLHCPTDLPEPQPCPAEFQMQFGDLDAGLLESALLGAHEKTTLLSDLIDRLHPSASPPWPALEGTVKADSLVLGPVTLQGVSAALRVLPSSVEIASLDAGLLGGSIHVAGSLDKARHRSRTSPRTLSRAALRSSMSRLSALCSACAGLELPWTATARSSSPATPAKDLTASAHGALHFECRRGAIGNQPSESSKAGPVPAALGRFNAWTADAAIANGAPHARSEPRLRWRAQAIRPGHRHLRRSAGGQLRWVEANCSEATVIAVKLQ